MERDERARIEEARLEEARRRHHPRVVVWPEGDPKAPQLYSVRLESVSRTDIEAVTRASMDAGCSVLGDDGSVLVTGSSQALEILAERAEDSLRGLFALPADTLARFLRRNFRVPLPRGEIRIGPKPCLMGVLNVTPDSFSDGGRFADPERAIEQGLVLAAAGSALIDVGGESTRPGSDPVPEAEQIRRVVPVIRELARRISVPISIDTQQHRVAEAAIEVGAALINDVSGLDHDPLVADVAARARAPLILMHLRGTPKTMQVDPRYDDLLGEVTRSLRDRVARALAAGVAEEAILVDPGIGFGKTLDHNLELLRRLPELRSLGRPLVVGPSRKSFLGTLTGKPVGERLLGTAAAVAAAALHGAGVIRVHDVAEMRDVVAVAGAIGGEAVS